MQEPQVGPILVAWSPPHKIAAARKVMILTDQLTLARRGVPSFDFERVGIIIFNVTPVTVGVKEQNKVHFRV
jgi:hypothetical protein